MAFNIIRLFGIVLLASADARRIQAKKRTNVKQQTEKHALSTDSSVGTDVYANVYDLDDSAGIAVLNTIAFLGGAYHVGIEAFGVETMYGGLGDCCETGISISRTPKQHSVHKFYKSVHIGTTRLDKHAFQRLVQQMAASGAWRGVDYDLLRKNCIVYSEALLQALPEKYSLPFWMKRLMNVGAAILPSLANGIGALSTVSVSMSEASAAGSQSSQAQNNATMYAGCSHAFKNACGPMLIGPNWFSVSCPVGSCCHQYQGHAVAQCVPFCPGQKDHLYSNNANGACAR